MLTKNPSSYENIATVEAPVNRRGLPRPPKPASAHHSRRPAAQRTMAANNTLAANRMAGNMTKIHEHRT